MPENRVDPRPEPTRKPPRVYRTGSRALKYLERRAIAFEMRKEGFSYREIADAIRMSPEAAYRLVKREVVELVTLTKEDAEEVRQLELERLDAMLAGGLMKRAMTGKDDDAVDRVIKIMERRSKYSGLDAASRTEITGKDGRPIEVEDPRELLNRRLDELAQRAGAGDSTPGDVHGGGGGTS